jgi:hypothetical protein
MLGPALSHLYANLDGRRDKLTGFERAVHRELLEAMHMARFIALNVPLSSKSVGGALARSGEFSLQEALGAGKGRGISDLFDVGPGLKVEVDLSGGGWAGPDTLQTGCTYPNCPNKEQ